MRKKVDSRIRTLVENCVKTGQRSLFVIVGDKGRDQVRRTSWCSCCCRWYYRLAMPASLFEVHVATKTLQLLRYLTAVLPLAC